MLRWTVVLAGLGTIALLLTACEGGGPDTPAAESGQPADTVEAEKSLAELLAAADVDQGKRLYLQCRACHSLEKGGINKVGPNLYGFFGQPAGQVEDFAYSDALQESEIVWTPETLDRWLARPSEFLPGNRMVFVGVRRPTDRASLIAYLQQKTGATR
ncbi:MAG: cytochrome c family protein [Gammaproteobacteria bacterium]|nr:cytochrome c family protein [Gammaproteobacteria bacterium]